eukprot:scaffold9445_cov59-Phaeocystis_antarctica.AAC.8
MVSLLDRRLPILRCGRVDNAVCDNTLMKLGCAGVVFKDWKGKLANETFAGSARNGTAITRKRPRALWHRCKLLAVLRAS